MEKGEEEGKSSALGLRQMKVSTPVSLRLHVALWHLQEWVFDGPPGMARFFEPLLFLKLRWLSTSGRVLGRKHRFSKSSQVLHQAKMP